MEDQKVQELRWDKIKAAIHMALPEVVKGNWDIVLGIANGGVPIAVIWADLLHVPFKTVQPYSDIREFKDKKVLIVDDIRDTGATLKHFEDQLKDKTHGVWVYKDRQKLNGDKSWFKFPWETKNDTTRGISQAVTSILRGVGEDPLREGLEETPKRVEKAWRFWTRGYGMKPKDVIKTFTNEGNGEDTGDKKIDQLVVVPKIDFYSHCEHHLAPFYGQVHIGYLPGSKVLGVSKFARLVDIYSRRLQIQERMTQQIAEAIMKHLEPQGVGVVAKGIHLCMRSRGVEKQNSEMVTSVMLGKFREDNDLRKEFLSML